MTELTESASPTGSRAAPTQAGGDTGNPKATPTPSYPPDNSGNRAAAWVGGVLLVVVLVALLIAFIGAFRHWFALHTGTLHGGPDVYYNFWSGFGSDLGEATLISAVCAGVYTGMRKVNCHTKGC